MAYNLGQKKQILCSFSSGQTKDDLGGEEDMGQLVEVMVILKIDSQICD